MSFFTQNLIRQFFYKKFFSKINISMSYSYIEKTTLIFAGSVAMTAVSAVPQNLYIRKLVASINVRACSAAGILMEMQYECSAAVAGAAAAAR